MFNITCLSRIRNESLLLPDFLNHIDKFVDEAFYFDDASVDNSVEILRKHPKTKKVLRNYFHNQNQSFVQTAQRHLLLNYAKANSKNTWFFLLEPDERIVEFDFSLSNNNKYHGIFLSLLDGYLTEKMQVPYKQGDKLENLKRMWGIEKRQFCYFFNKNYATYDLAMPGIAQPTINGKTFISDGWAKHYSKCLSVEHWNETVEYYVQSMPILAKKWEARRGKAIHTLSDFNTPLYKWEEAKKNSTLI